MLFRLSDEDTPSADERLTVVVKRHEKSACENKRFFGVEEGIRTLDLRNHNPSL